MKKTLPPVPAGTEPELRAFLEALRTSIKMLEEKAVTANGVERTGSLTAEQIERSNGRENVTCTP